MQAAFQSTYCFRADQGDGPLFLDEEHGLLRVGEDGWVLAGKALTLLPYLRGRRAAVWKAASVP